MSSARERMKQAHSNKGATTPAVPPERLTPSPVVVDTKPEPESLRPEAPPAQPPKVVTQVKQQADIPTGVRQIARDDVPITSYGKKPVPTNFNVYNKELWKWLTGFSSDNRFNGGVSITKSQLMEICLDVMMYDLGINPIGYESQQQLREDIQNKIKGAY